VSRYLFGIADSEAWRIRMGRSRRRRILFAVLTSLVALVLPASLVLAGTLTLHPAGFGEKSRANWKAKEGVTGDQAFYMQKMVPTATFAAGVALIKGFEGQAPSALTGLAWKHRVDGHCGAGAPRWNIGLKDNSGTEFVAFLGCYEAGHAAVPANAQWCEDFFGPTDIAAHVSAAAAAAGANAADLKIRYLAILFDEGTDNPIPQPPGCPAGPSTPGFVFLDDITVNDHVWSSASDNGNTAFIGTAAAYADELPSTADILAELQDVVPGVPLTSWVLYPDVEPADVPLPGLP
jgi:hypothetical protein